MKNVILSFIFAFLPFLVSLQAQVGIQISTGNTHCIETDPFGYISAGVLYRIVGQNDQFKTDFDVEYRTGNASGWYASGHQYYDFFKLYQNQLDPKNKWVISPGVGARYNGNTNKAEILGSGRTSYLHGALDVNLGFDMNFLTLTDHEWPDYDIYLKVIVLLDWKDN